MTRRGRSVPQAGVGSPRSRLLASAGALARRIGWEAVTVERICADAGVSKRTFYALFADRGACIEASMDEAEAALRAALDAGPAHDDGPAAGHRRLAAALQDDPSRAWLTVVEPLAHARSPRVVPMTTGARALLALAGERVAEQRRAQPLDELAESAIYLDLAPVAGRRAAVDEARRPIALPLPPRPPAAPPQEPAPRLSVLARATLLHLDEHPGDSNVAIAEGVGIRLESQVSRHLKALEHAGLLQHEREGRRNRWALTPAGRVVAARLR